MMRTTEVATQLGNRFQLAKAPNAVVSAGRKRKLSFVELKSLHHAPFETAPRVKEDAFIVGVIVREFPDYKFWEDGKQARMQTLLKGQVTVNDMRLDGRAIMDSPFHTVYCHIPRSALDDVFNEEGHSKLGRLIYQPGIGMDDEVIRNLILSARSAMLAGEAANRLYLDHVGIALVSHLASNYGEKDQLAFLKGGLAPWQEKRAKEMIDACITEPLGTDDLARECGLSVRHFTRAFLTTVGSSPHEWLRYRRVEMAKSLLVGSQLNLTEIAASCGFADPGHFSRVFRAVVGTTPTKWRREVN
jgi:AraC family transcriptional regulator